MTLPVTRLSLIRGTTMKIGSGLVYLGLHMRGVAVSCMLPLVSWLVGRTSLSLCKIQDKRYIAIGYTCITTDK